MSRSWLALLAGISVTALACAGEPREEESAGRQRAEQTPISGGCPAGWPGPWTSCPEADWVQELTERAGYRITGKTGSALIAKGEGSSFYIWATEAPSVAIREASQGAWEPLGRVEGVQVFGDESLWRWWVVDDSVLWLQAGPYEHSRLPSLEEIEALVRASESVPQPR
jgi:hypothetical protein